MFGAATSSPPLKKTVELEGAISGSSRDGCLLSRAGAIAAEVEAMSVRLSALESSIGGSDFGGEGGIVARIGELEKLLRSFQG